MQYLGKRDVVLGLGMLLSIATPAWADVAAGTEAFKNKDYQKAFREWNAAAEAGNAEAQFDLGVLYAQGRGVQRDVAKAVSWYRKAADQGNAEAQFALGQLYSRGWGVPRDEIDALRWFQMANDPNSVGSATDWELIEGYGVERDSQQAASWYQKAAEQGHAEAQYNLGRLYAAGKGIPRDEELAVNWIRASASQGYVPAQALFGTRYATGSGIAQDHRLAYLWLTLAFLHGDKSVEKLRSAEAAKLTPAVVAATDQAAQSWRPRAAAAPKP
jgi:uncharacterized protein